MDHTKKTVLTMAFLVLIIILGSFLIHPLFPSPTEEGVSSDRISLLYQQDESQQRSAAVIIEVYSDFQCPFCKEVLPTLQELKRAYGTNVFIEYKHFPIVSLHPKAQQAAEASECARDQDKFWQYHDLLFFNQNRMERKDFIDYAQQLGLDLTVFNTCLDSRKKQQIVEQHLAEGLQRGVRGTPTFLVNDVMLSGVQAKSAFEKIIDGAIKKVKN